MIVDLFERIIFETSRGVMSRFRIVLLKCAGLSIGVKCRLEKIRVRKPRLIRIGNGNTFFAGCWLWPENSASKTFRIEIGNNNYFNRDVMIDACGLVKIGNFNMFGPRVYITDSNHVMTSDRWVGYNPMERGQVVVGDGCWIGCGAIILKGVTLGDRCIVGAGAVVTKSVPPGAIVVGVPARQLEKAND